MDLLLNLCHSDERLENYEFDKEFSLSQFLITKMLTKHPNQYPDGDKLPHVTVAKRLIMSGVQEQQLVGHVIYYGICLPTQDQVHTDLPNRPFPCHSSGRAHSQAPPGER